MEGKVLKLKSLNCFFSTAYQNNKPGKMKVKIEATPCESIITHQPLLELINTSIIFPILLSSIPDIKTIKPAATI
jgi:hypothetical protein